MYPLLADLVVISHFAFILFVVFGALAAWRWQWMPYVHLPAMAWGAATEFFAIVCPLTYLENYLRNLGGEAGLETSFIEHYLVPIVYPPVLNPALQLGLGSLLVSWNALLYYLLWRRRRKHDNGLRHSPRNY